MKLSAPKKIVFIIALIIAVFALVMVLVPFSFLFGAVWWALIAFALLALANLLKGL